MKSAVTRNGLQAREGRRHCAPTLFSGNPGKLSDETHSWDAYRRWRMVSAEPWSGLDLGNAAQVGQAMKRLEEAHYQAGEKEWTYFRD